MSLTTAEAGWIGIALGGGVSFVSSWITLVANRSNTHQQRIWERATDLYEHLLFEAASWTAIRAKAMETLLTDEDREVLTVERAERQRILIRLEMIGHPDVRAAFERYGKAHWDWIACEEARQFAFDTNQEALDQHNMPHVSPAEVTQLRENRLAASRLANDRHEELREVVQRVVRRVPKRRFRRS